MVGMDANYSDDMTIYDINITYILYIMLYHLILVNG
jgi:hypothetical protein